MPSDPTTALLAGIRAVLIEDPVIATLVGASRVYSFPPSQMRTPSITMSEVVTVDASTSDTYADEITVDIHAWSRVEAQDDGDATGQPSLMLDFLTGAYAAMHPDESGIRALVAAIYAALHDGDVAAEGHNLFLIRVGNRRILRDPDSMIRHGIVTVTALVGHA